ncbi:hypothetical protein Pint_22423 [Pistacia integerrima]|uniref:Uncharacterized protein n=1 Tax=Pistacia integerrima TaxID=434235 RepID=A0ACC0YIK4_9ROSI|nr:hypothetical protein Pint_22423 [Pistacia integerrima]
MCLNYAAFCVAQLRIGLQKDMTIIRGPPAGQNDCKAWINNRTSRMHLACKIRVDRNPIVFQGVIGCDIKKLKQNIISLEVVQLAFVLQISGIVDILVVILHWLIKLGGLTVKQILALQQILACCHGGFQLQEPSLPLIKCRLDVNLSDPIWVFIF